LASFIVISPFGLDSIDLHQSGLPTSGVQADRIDAVVTINSSLTILVLVCICDPLFTVISTGSEQPLIIVVSAARITEADINKKRPPSKGERF
jgi:hypothetical protein